MNYFRILRKFFLHSTNIKNLPKWRIYYLAKIWHLVEKKTTKIQNHSIFFCPAGSWRNFVLDTFPIRTLKKLHLDPNKINKLPTLLDKWTRLCKILSKNKKTSFSRQLERRWLWWSTRWHNFRNFFSTSFDSDVARLLDHKFATFLLGTVEWEVFFNPWSTLPRYF